MTDEETKKLIGCVGLIVFIPVNIVIACLMDAWALTKLWAWFILPVFPSMPSLTGAQAVGLGLIVGYLTHQVFPSKDGQSIGESIAQSLSGSLLRPLMVVLIGFVIHQFVS